jgi:hypothetical protein
VKADEWPEDGEHLFGPWRADRLRQGDMPPTQNRACVHPECHHVEHREAPRG